MRYSTILAALAASLALTAPAWATDGGYAPEVGADGSLAAITAVGAVAAIIRERRRRLQK
jgi:hypothetical protein